MKSDGTHRWSVGQSRQAAGTRPLAFHEADTLFALAENQIALLRRCRPANGPATLQAWLAAYRRDARARPDWRYPPAPSFGPLRRALEQAALELLEAGPLGGLYAARAQELELEARLAEQIGSPGFAALARERHREGAGAEWAEARRLAVEWSSLERRTACGPGDLEHEPRHASEDRHSPDSLHSVLAREIGQRRWPIRLVLVPDLASRAACADGVIYVGTGHWLTASEARRVSLHELLGHALPRLEARAHPLGLLRVGSARSSDDEEGRALHIEAAHDLLDVARRRELGLRHSAAAAVAGGADAHECLAHLGRFGCDIDEASAIYARVARGGGLCREIEYLPAWLRYSTAREAEPAVAEWLGQARLSLAAARVLIAAQVHPARASSTFSTCHWQAAELPRSPT